MHFLTTRTAPSEYTVVRKEQLVVKEVNYQLIVENLHKLGSYGILRRCVLEKERTMILVEAREGVTGVHYTGKETMQKILCTGL